MDIIPINLWQKMIPSESRWLEELIVQFLRQRKISLRNDIDFIDFAKKLVIRKTHEIRIFLLKFFSLP